MAIYSHQERKLGEEERRDLAKQTAALEADIQSGSGSAEMLRQAAASYSALGESQKAFSTLEKLTEMAPLDPEAWQLLVRCLPNCVSSLLLLTRALIDDLVGSAPQAEARGKLGDAKGAVAAYKRAVGEVSLPDLALLQGLADALTADARQQEAIDFLSAQQPKPQTGVDAVDLQLLIGKVSVQFCALSHMAAID